jgi:uncharacterized membrane protein
MLSDKSVEKRTGMDILASVQRADGKRAQWAKPNRCVECTNCLVGFMSRCNDECMVTCMYVCMYVIMYRKRYPLHFLIDSTFAFIIVIIAIVIIVIVNIILIIIHHRGDELQKMATSKYEEREKKILEENEGLRKTILTFQAGLVRFC